MNKKIEILAPAGSLESLKAAVCAGADAVYMGGSRFGARAYADNPDETKLLQAIDYAHIHGRKIYLTVNTLLKDREMEELYQYLLPYYKQGVDGIIIQDVGVLSCVKEWFPKLSLHASTQMTVTSARGAQFLKQQGIERIVPARELSLSEIRHMKEESGLEVECFVHGALCYSYSGQCLLSSLIGGRSGNRGQCAQPCRLAFQVDQGKAATVLSLKDLCTIDILPDLVEAGIDSFKIEGRMKQPDYVYTVVELYRRYVDRYMEHGRKQYHVSKEDKERLLSVYQRRGYSDGYYHTQNSKQMISFARPQGVEQPKEVESEYKIQERINGNLILSVGKHATLMVSCDGTSVIQEGAVVEQASKQPLSVERIEKQMKKTGETPFVFDELSVVMSEEVFLPMQHLNELRRETLQLLLEERLTPYRRTSDVIKQMNRATSKESQTIEPDISTEQMILSASVGSSAQLQAVQRNPNIQEVYVDTSMGMSLDTSAKKCIKSMRADGRRVFLAMPYIFREQAEQAFNLFYESMLMQYDGVLIRNFESLQWLRDHRYEKEIRSDHNVYAFNRYSRAFLSQVGIASLTAPLELNERELSRGLLEGATFIVYGYMPVMITANCIRSTSIGCDHKENVHLLQDRYKKTFRVRNNCTCCYNVIYNSTPLVLLDQKDSIQGLCPKELRLDFTSETPQEVEAIIASYVDVFIKGTKGVVPQTEFTKGHYKRGVK